MMQYLRVSTFVFLTTLLAMTGLLFSGCAGGDTAATDNQAEPQFQLEVREVKHYSKIGSKTEPGGQFLVVTTAFRNETAQDQEVVPKEVTLRYIGSEEPEEQFEQGLETNMKFEFRKTFGQEPSEMLLDFMPVVVHPRFTIQRYLLFAVPSDISLDDYEIKYAKFNVTTPLVTRRTLVEDHRHDAA
ncbi:MAG: hypothetical protein KTR14_04090 [Vampirovibrio sp.]|nr:hypothetical protein [Vampirovibrio sp.]